LQIQLCQNPDDTMTQDFVITKWCIFDFYTKKYAIYDHKSHEVIRREGATPTNSN